MSESWKIIQREIAKRKFELIDKQRSEMRTEVKTKKVSHQILRLSYVPKMISMDDWYVSRPFVHIIASMRAHASFALSRGIISFRRFPPRRNPNSRLGCQEANPSLLMIMIRVCSYVGYLGMHDGLFLWQAVAYSACLFQQ